jgi:hypothetical protein
MTPCALASDAYGLRGRLSFAAASLVPIPVISFIVPEAEA